SGRADAERKCHESDSRKPGLLPQSAKRVARVLQKVLQPACATGIAAALLHLLRTAKREPRLPPSFLSSKAAGNQIGRVLVEMETQPFFELFFHLPSPPHAPPERHTATPPSR